MRQIFWGSDSKLYWELWLVSVSGLEKKKKRNETSRFATVSNLPKLISSTIKTSSIENQGKKKAALPFCLSFFLHQDKRHICSSVYSLKMVLIKRFNLRHCQNVPSSSAQQVLRAKSYWLIFSSTQHGIEMEPIRNQLHFKTSSTREITKFYLD